MTKNEIKRYFHGKTHVGTVVEEDGRREFEVEMDEFDVYDAVETLGPQSRVHMQRDAYGLFRALQAYDQDPVDFVDDDDVRIVVADSGAQNLTQLSKMDRTAYDLLRQKDLQDVFVEMTGEFESHDLSEPE